MQKLLVLAALALVVGLMNVRGEEAQADSEATCGDVLTTDTTLISPLDCSGTALTIAADDITLKCKAQHLTGDGTGNDILLDNVSGVTVKNCQVRNFGIGIFLLSSSGIPSSRTGQRTTPAAAAVASDSVFPMAIPSRTTLLIATPVAASC